MNANVKVRSRPRLVAVIVATVALTTLSYFFLIAHNSTPEVVSQTLSQPAVIEAIPNPPKLLSNGEVRQPAQDVRKKAAVGQFRLPSRTSPDSTPTQLHSTVATTAVNIAPQHSANSATNTAVAGATSWESFASWPMSENGIRRTSRARAGPLNPNNHPILCSGDVTEKLAAPRLSSEDFSWCKWAISPKGGNVVVGKSWGNLRTKPEQMKFDTLNCNAVQNGKNPSCDDSWGDRHIEQWRLNKVNSYICEDGRKSRISCQANDNADKFCTIENAQINFSKMKKVSRGGAQTPSKKFEKNFISADCGSGGAPAGFPFAHLYSPQVSSQQCDYVHNGTLLVFSHDDIRNLGHTLNDIMNVWIMMWLDGVARDSHNLNMLNIDSFKLGHNFDDQPNVFFLPYTKNLKAILKGMDFGTSTLCAQKILVQPLPPRFFIWESWFTDMPCSFIGPSSLYQRWNYHVRHSYGLLRADEDMALNKRLQVLLVVRNEKTNLWGSSRTSRNYLNTKEITDALSETVKAISEKFPATLVVQDLSQLDFEAQLQLISESSIMVGMHGAGMASSMHMAVGTKYCCGMLEIYPKGEFTPIRGHGNMARKMGLHYDRVDVAAADSQSHGATVPAGELSQALAKMVARMVEKPTCVIQSVVDDPFLEAVL